MNSYERGTKIQVQTAFVDANGDAVDPDTVTLVVTDPNKETVTYSKGNLTNPVTGTYVKLVELTQRGVWRFYFLGATESPEGAHASTTRVYCMDTLAGSTPEAADQVSEPENTAMFNVNWRSQTGTVLDEDGNTVTIPEHSVVTRVLVVLQTDWDALTSFQLGQSGDSDWLVTNTEHGLTGDAYDTNIINADVVVLADTPLLMTFDQGAATRGEAYILVEYINYA
jgi:hypothetical protein